MTSFPDQALGFWLHELSRTRTHQRLKLIDNTLMGKDKP